MGATITKVAIQVVVFVLDSIVGMETRYGIFAHTHFHNNLKRLGDSRTKGKNQEEQM